MRQFGIFFPSSTCRVVAHKSKHSHTHTHAHTHTVAVPYASALSMLMRTHDFRGGWLLVFCMRVYASVLLETLYIFYADALSFSAWRGAGEESCNTHTDTHKTQTQTQTHTNSLRAHTCALYVAHLKGSFTS